MNVFVDFHHAALLQSFILLFEKRLGGMVFRPIGADWFERGYWKVYDHPATVQQYLGINAATPDGTPPLNETEGRPPVAGIYYCKDIESHSVNRAITYDGFMHMSFDIVIASLPYHIEPFKKLCSEHTSKPKLIYQIGNAWTIEAGLSLNIMASAIIENIPENINFIQYHQEFDLKTFEPFSLNIADDDVLTFPEKKINSFINCFGIAGHFAEDWQQFQRIEQMLPDWQFRSFGGQCRDGSCDGSKALADEMRHSRFIWHTKNGGDGYGHILHNAAAVGRPMIVKKQYYAGKMGDKLLLDGETCIAIDGLNNQQIIDKILFYSTPDNYSRLCLNTYQNFKRVVNFDKEEVEIRAFLNRLQ